MRCIWASFSAPVNLWELLFPPPVERYGRGSEIDRNRESSLIMIRVAGLPFPNRVVAPSAATFCAPHSTERQFVFCFWREYFVMLRKCLSYLPTLSAQSSGLPGLPRIDDATVVMPGMLSKVALTFF